MRTFGESLQNQTGNQVHTEAEFVCLHCLFRWFSADIFSQRLTTHEFYYILIHSELWIANTFPTPQWKKKRITQ